MTDGVWGVTVLHDVIYVVCDKSAIIRTFDTSTYQPLTGINVDGLRYPTDIVACSGTDRLYVSDYEGRCVWKVDVSSNSTLSAERFEKWISNADELKVRSLSVTSRLLLVTFDDSTIKLHQYDDSGQLITAFTPPTYVREVLHAVWTSRQTYIVCHRGTSSDGEQSAVTEMKSDGSVVRQVKEMGADKWWRSPVYLTSVDDDFTQLLVCYISHVSCIRVFSDLQKVECGRVEQRDVVGSQQVSLPRGLHYDKLNGRLYVIHCGVRGTPRRLSVFSLR